MSKQDLAPVSLGRNGTGREYKPGLLVAQATVKGFDKPWSNLVDSGASCSYARRLSLERSQQYVEALNSHESDTVTFRLTTKARVTVP